MSLRDLCFKFYWNIQSVIAPTLRYSQLIYEDVLKENADSNKIWLDLGCGHQLLPQWRFNEEARLTQNAKLLIGLDYDFNSLKKHRTISNRIRGDIKHLPFADNSFNLITSNMVFEHLSEPEKQMTEIFRILKPGGILLFHTPNSLGYCTIFAKLIPELIKDKLILFLQGRKEEDIFPAYYRINSKQNIKKIAQMTGFHVEEFRLLVSSAQTVMIPPVVVFELIWIRTLMTNSLKAFRTNIIAKLRKPNNSTHWTQIDLDE